MPLGRDDMQVNVAGLRRNIKNLAHNYSDAQVWPCHITTILLNSIINHIFSQIAREYLDSPTTVDPTYTRKCVYSR